MYVPMQGGRQLLKVREKYLVFAPFIENLWLYANGPIVPLTTSCGSSNLGGLLSYTSSFTACVYDH